MPVMSGPEFVTELRRRGFTLPVIVLSGLPDAESAYEGLNVVFRLKPLDPDSLIRLVQDLLGECMRRSACHNPLVGMSLLSFSHATRN